MVFNTSISDKGFKNRYNNKTKKANNIHRILTLSRTLNISFISFDWDNDTATIHYDSRNERNTIDEVELLDLARKSVDTLDSDSLSEVQHFYDNIESFHNFMDRCVPNFSDELDAPSKGGTKL